MTGHELYQMELKTGDMFFHNSIGYYVILISYLERKIYLQEEKGSDEFFKLPFTEIETEQELLTT